MSVRQLMSNPEQLVGSLLQLTSRTAEASKPLEARIRNIAASVAHPEARIAFGGHFNAGKSTLLNALLGRGILPVDDLPETGIDCWIRHSSEDRGSVLVDNRSRPIEITTENIRYWSGLVTTSGHHRPEIGLNRRLFLELASCPVPAETVWIDTMGFNDDQLLDDRLRQITSEMDVLVWVVNTNQLLSEREQAFLADFLQSHGPQALLFVLNVQLSQDSEDDFQARLKKNRSAWHKKIAYFWKEVVDSPIPPPIVETAARALCHTPDGFGGPELRKMLRELSGIHSPRVAASRFYRAAAAVGDLTSEIAAQLAAREKEDQPQKRSETHLSAAWQALDQRDYDAVLLHAAAASDLGPRLVEPLLARSIALIYKDQKTFADIAAERCLRLDENFVRARFARAWARSSSNRHNEVAEDLDIYLSSSEASGWMRSVGFYLRACAAISANRGGSGRVQALVDDLCAAAADPAGLLRIAVVPAALLLGAACHLERSGKLKEAIPLYKRALEAIPAPSDNEFATTFIANSKVLSVTVDGMTPLVAVRRRLWEACKQLHGGETRIAAQTYLAANAGSEPHEAYSPTFCLHMASICAERKDGVNSVAWLKVLLQQQPDFNILTAKRDPYIRSSRGSEPLKSFLTVTTFSEYKSGVLSNYLKVTNTSAFKLSDLLLDVVVLRADKKTTTLGLSGKEVGAGQALMWGNIFKEPGIFGLNIQTVTVTVRCPEAGE